MSLFNAHNITVKFGDQTLVEDVSFSIEEGQILAIVGPNGSGKTTLMKAILGLIPHTGEVHWHKEARVGYVPQHFTFDRTFPITVFELFSLKLPHASLLNYRNSSHRAITALLSEVRAEKLIDKPLGSLSGGELQRVFIAFALAANPKVLFFDEPSSGIDIGGEETIYTLIHQLSKKKGLAIVLISHDLDVVYKHANLVICLNKKMLCHGIPKEMLTAATLEKLYGEHAGHYEHDNQNEPHHHHHRDQR